MSYSAKVVDAIKQRSHCLVVVSYENDALSPTASRILEVDASVGSIIKREKFQGKSGQSLLLLNPQGIAAERLLFIGAGAQDKDGAITAEQFRKALQRALDVLKGTTASDIVFFLDEIVVKNVAPAWQAALLAEKLSTFIYRSDKLKSKLPENLFTPGKIIYATSKAGVNAATKALAQGEALAKGMNLARDLGDLPGNICTPSYLADEAKKLARNQSKLAVKVLEEKHMAELKMGSLLSVSAGSDQPAKLIVLEYRGGSKNDTPIALVGKGITFDTGGISLKPGAGMDEMKYDMCGAASVLGVFQTLIELQPSINVVGVVAASENMPSGKATKPGDIVTSMSGQTIEILNTDAEGRLVLCDALTYTERFKPKAVIDIATLTGACVIALGNHATGLFSNNDDLAEALLDAGKQAHDRAWHMPLWDDYQKQLDSNFADMANIGGREGGSITAACFLSRFAKKFPWAHLDIAGTAWKSGSAKGATGRPVPLLVQYLLNQA
jgi:leucyl aminopeptidase